MAKSKLARYKKRRSKKKNPLSESAVLDLGIQVGAGFAGYTATRLLSRIAYAQALKRWPNMAPHLAAAMSALSAGGVFFGTKYWEKAEDYHEAATIGAGIALLQTVFQTYVPKLGWITSDVRPEQYAAKANHREVTLDELSEFGIDDPDIAEIEASADAGDNFERLLAESNDIEAVPLGDYSEAHESMAMAELSGDDDDLEHFNGFMN